MIDAKRHDKFVKEIVSEIKECGQSLIDSAEAMVPKDIELLSTIDIHVKLGINESSCPIIEYNVEFIPKLFADRLEKVGMYTDPDRNN